MQATAIVEALDVVEDIAASLGSRIECEVVEPLGLDRRHSSATPLPASRLMAGEGTGLAIAEAYILAGELHACGGDFRAPFAPYKQRLMPFLRSKQASAATFASSFAPKTSFGTTFRNVATKLMRVSSLAELFIDRAFRDDIEARSSIR